MDSTRPHQTTLRPRRATPLGRLRLGVAALAAAALATACHAYAPSELGQVNAGDQVRALLTPDQAGRFAETLPAGGRLVEGVVVEAGAGEMLLEVPVVTRLEGIRVESYNQRLRIPQAGIADLELRSLARGRTYALAGVAAAVLGWVVWDQFLADSDRNPIPPLPPIIEFGGR